MARGFALAVGLAACVQRAPYLCQSNEQCVSQGQRGTCEPTQFCSFPDPGCPSGQRYADFSGELSGQCVMTSAGDGGPPDGPTFDSFTNVVPSNGIDPSLLGGVSAGLDVRDGENWVMDTGTGEITRCDGVQVRAAGDGLIAGIGVLTVPAPPDGAGLTVFAVENISVAQGGQLYAVGPRAVVVLVRGDVTVSGVIDVSGGFRACTANATCGLMPGTRDCGGPGGFAGGVPTAGGPGSGGNNSDLHGGGGGGFGESGGDGGGGTGAAQGGDTYGTMRLAPLIGGSGGGGAVSLDSGIDRGGGGGGALQITALGTITIEASGRIGATGAGGGAGGLGGGGGGGAGGAILLEAPALVVDGRLSANGGGGAGAGGTPTDGTDGTFGPNPAPGGTGNFPGGEGGSLLTRAGDGQPPVDTVGSTGGGGGGAGRIVLRSTTMVEPGGDISPDPFTLPDLLALP